MHDIFTVEEINLMCIYDTSNRTALLSDLKMSLVDVYEPEMREIFNTSIAKLEKLTDTEFSDICSASATQAVRYANISKMRYCRSIPNWKKCLQAISNLQ